MLAPLAAPLHQAVVADPVPLSSQGPWAGWKPGAEVWIIKTETYPLADANKDKAEPKPTATTMYVSVSGPGRVNGADCWTLGFNPAGSASPPGGPQYYVMVDQKNGWARSAVPVKGPPPAVLRTVGEATLLAGAPTGYPLETFPFLDSFETKDDATGASFKLHKEISGKETVIEASYRSGTGEDLLIRQKWLEGENWWREYERNVNGRKDLVATRDTPPPGSPNVVTPASTAHYLGYDARLQGLMTVVEENPSLDDLLARLRSTTGLNLTVDPSLAQHKPRFGSVQFKNAPAWALMGHIEQTQLDGGHWDKVEGGYRLTGTSTVPPPPALPRDPSAAFRWWLTGGSLLAVAAVGGWFAYRRFWKKPVTSHGQHPR